MAKKVEFKLNLPGLNELMKSSAMQSHMDEVGRRIAGNAGEGFESQTYVLNYVAVSHVFPTTGEAAAKNSRDNTLLKALGCAGLSMK